MFVQKANGRDEASGIRAARVPEYMRSALLLESLSASGAEESVWLSMDAGNRRFGRPAGLPDAVNSQALL